MGFSYKELFGRAIDMACGALLACLVCGAVTTGAALGFAIGLGLANLAFDLSLDDDEDDC